jgi:V/A-type H+-transporting ATPase subunit I
MAVSEMKKLSLISPKNEVGDLTDLLFRLRCIEVESLPLDCGEGEEPLSRTNSDAERQRYDRLLQRTDDMLVILHKRCKNKKKPFAQGPRVDILSFEGDERYEKGLCQLENSERITSRLAELKSEELKIESSLKSYRVWQELDIPLSFDGTSQSKVLLGSFESKEGADLAARSVADEYGALLSIVSEDASSVSVAVLCHASSYDDVSRSLASSGFSRANFKGVDMTAADAVKQCELRLDEISKQRQSLESELDELARDVLPIEMLSDYYRTRLESAAVKSKMAETDNLVCLSAWVPIDETAKVEKSLSKLSCSYELTDPEPSDEPPVLLKNGKFSGSFEWVLKMYSYPVYGRYDPTAIMSIFYFLIFGLMFADVGYGALLVIGCFGAIKLFKPGRGMHAFLAMFGYCGISCILWGILLGAYFGDMPNAIATNMLGKAPVNLALWFDPLTDPMSFLILSLGVGAVHLIGGMAVKFYLLCKDGHVLDAVFDVGSWWVLFAGIGLLFALPAVGKWVAIAGAAMLVLTQGRAEKNIVMKLLKGVMSLYDIINYISDLLSYSRILALGLAAGVIAQVVNILGTMGGSSIVGFIGLIVAFSLGHVLNFAINVLGTFVHTSRLQYIEFFGKFYEDGGRPFKAVAPASKYTAEE